MEKRKTERWYRGGESLVGLGAVGGGGQADGRDVLRELDGLGDAQQGQVVVEDVADEARVHLDVLDVDQRRLADVDGADVVVAEADAEQRRRQAQAAAADDAVRRGQDVAFVEQRPSAPERQAVGAFQEHGHHPRPLTCPTQPSIDRVPSSNHNNNNNNNNDDDGDDDGAELERPN